MAEPVDRPALTRGRRLLHGEVADLPVGVNDLVVRLTDDRAEALAAAEIVNAVHQAVARLGERSRSVPIIELRVTRLASAPSSQSSTPFGRSRHDEIAPLRRRVPDTHLRALIKLDAELLKHAAWVTHHAGAIFVRFVPGWRETQDRERIAGAERADDEIMHVRRVLDRLQMAGRMASETEFADRRRPVSQESRLERGIAPGACDDGSAALRSDLIAIHFDPGVDRGRIDELLLGKQAFQRLRPQRRLGWQMRMQLVMDMGNCLRIRSSPSRVLFRPGNLSRCKRAVKAGLSRERLVRGRRGEALICGT